MTARPADPPPLAPAPAAVPVDLDLYRPGRPCWVWRGGQWRPGVILCATIRAATVRYLSQAGGTAVDTVTADQLAPATTPPAPTRLEGDPS